MDICYDEEPNISETKGVKLLQISKEFVGIISSTRHIKEGGIQISFVFMLYFKGKNKKGKWNRRCIKKHLTSSKERIKC